MEIRVNNIVRLKGTNKFYEVTEIIGEIALCKSINEHNEAFKNGWPFKKSELEVIMDEDTDAFNILFKKDISDA